jgi:hypothetical protein
MVLNTKVISASFGQIKKKLDPAFTYLVFEQENVEFLEKSFQEITRTLAAQEKIKFEVQAYRDADRSKVCLVLKTGPEAGEILKARFLDFNFSKDITFYVFDSKTKSISGE